MPAMGHGCKCLQCCNACLLSPACLPSRPTPIITAAFNITSSASLRVAVAAGCGLRVASCGLRATAGLDWTFLCGTLSTAAHVAHAPSRWAPLGGK
ncbi:hypothetical protein B0H67DRAFT_560676 [Lasiosphaeris hirsuta]|uniref:Uncharacterized protein n=1 Tax=Lasiosphaeris hirsuta TaxID=260670 RepID=A0AA40EAH3_9PEZI|nr:hypothetical protein B0H67DRAFT_560676 [Lasiosphaeris hirsuta]